MCTYVHQTGRVVQKSSSDLCPHLLPVFSHAYLVDIAAITVFFSPEVSSMHVKVDAVHTDGTGGLKNIIKSV